MSGAWQFFLTHAFDLFSVAGIIFGLGYTSASFRADTRSRRIGNLLALTAQHRDIWDELYATPALERVVRADADLSTDPVTEAESQFVITVILHLYCWHRAVLDGEVRPIDGSAQDIQEFFGLPIPAQVWSEKQVYYDADFRGYVDALINAAPDSPAGSTGKSSAL